jgi:hypothetical protein
MSEPGFYGIFGIKRMGSGEGLIRSGGFGDGDAG